MQLYSPMSTTPKRKSVRAPVLSSIDGLRIGVLENGKVKHNTDYWDMAGFLVQIGLMPAPEGVG